MSLSNPNSGFERTLPAVYNILTTEQKRAVRNHYIKLQHYMCFFCGSSLYQDTPKELKDTPIDWSLFPPEFTRYPIHLQHDHKTGYTEGAIHSFCNALMWQYYGK